MDISIVMRGFDDGAGADSFNETRNLGQHADLEGPSNYVIDEALDGVDRALHILGQKGNASKAGFRLQVLGTCERLIDLHREHPKVTETEVISELAKCMSSLPPAMVATTAGPAVIKVCEELQRQPESAHPDSGRLAAGLWDLSNTMIEQVASRVTLADAKDTWMRVMCSVVPCLGPSDPTLTDKVVAFVTTHASVAETTMVRKRCCELATIACTQLPPSTKIDSPTEEARTKLLQVIRKLAHDVSSEVRTAIVDVLPLWCKCLTAAEQRNTLLPILTSLCADDDAVVQERATVQTAVVCSDPGCKVQDEAVAIHFPYFERLAKTDNLAPEQEQLAAELIGPALYSAKSRCTDEQLVQYFEFVLQLTASDQVSTRRMISRNLPALVLVAIDASSPFARQRLCETLLDSCLMLADDDDDDVLRVLALGFHETCRCCIAEGMPAKAFGVLAKLLEGTSADVVNTAAAALEPSVTVLASRNRTFGAQQCAPSSLLATIAKVDKNLGTMWRPRVTLLKFTQSLGAKSVYPARLLFIKLMPYYAKIILAKASPRTVQATVIGCVVKLLRSTKREDQRLHAIKWMVDELADGPSASSKLIFIEICEKILSVFSRSFFKTHVYTPLLGLAMNTGVHEVSMRMLPLIPKLKMMLVLPVDRPLLKLVDNFMYNCASDVENKILTAAAGITSLALDAIASDSLWLDGEGRDGEADKGDALKVAAEDRDFVPTKKTDDKLDAKPGLPQLPSTKDRAGSGGAGRSLLVAKSLEDIYQVSPRPARRITTSTSAPSNVANELITGIRKSRSSVNRGSCSNQGGSAGRRRDSFIKARLRRSISSDRAGSTSATGGGGISVPIRRAHSQSMHASSDLPPHMQRETGGPRLSASTSEDSGLKARHRSSLQSRCGPMTHPPAGGLKTPRSPRSAHKLVSPQKAERRLVVRLPAKASAADTTNTGRSGSDAKVVTLPPIEVDGGSSKSKPSPNKKSSQKRSGGTR